MKNHTTDPYKCKTEAEFDKYLAWDLELGLCVGKVEDPFIGTFWTHYEAPSGFRGLADGVYLARLENGKFTTRPFKW